MYNQNILNETLKYISPDATNEEWYVFLIRVIKSEVPLDYYEFSLYYHCKDIDNVLELTSDYASINPKASLSEKQWEHLLSITKNTQNSSVTSPIYGIGNGIKQIKTSFPWHTLKNDILYLNIKFKTFLNRINDEEIRDIVVYGSIKRSNELTPADKLLKAKRIAQLEQKHSLEGFNKKNLNVRMLEKIDLFNFNQLLKSKPDIYAYLPECVQKIKSAINILKNDSAYKFIIHGKRDEAYHPLIINYTNVSEYKTDLEHYKKKKLYQDKTLNLFSTNSYVDKISILKLVHVHLMNTSNKTKKLEYINDLQNIIFKYEDPFGSRAIRDSQIKKVYADYIKSIIDNIAIEGRYTYIKSFIIVCSADGMTHISDDIELYRMALTALPKNEITRLARELYDLDNKKHPEHLQNYTNASSVLWHVLVSHFDLIEYDTRLYIINDFLKNRGLDKQGLNYVCREIFQPYDYDFDYDEMTPEAILELDKKILIKLLPEHTEFFTLGNILNYTFMDHLEQLNNQLNLSAAHKSDISEDIIDINSDDFLLCP